MVITATTTSRRQMADEAGNVQEQLDKDGNLIVVGSITAQGGTSGGPLTATTIAASGAVTAASVSSTGSVSSCNPGPASGSTVGASIKVKKLTLTSAQLLALT